MTFFYLSRNVQLHFTIGDFYTFYKNCVFLVYPYKYLYATANNYKELR